MRNFTKLLLILSGCFLFSLQGTAQTAPYKSGIGVSVLSMEAVSFKTFLKPHLALQVEFGYKWTETPFRYYYYGYDYYYGRRYYTTYVGSLEINPNLFYQSNIAQWNFAQLDWLAGGGLSFGMGFSGIGYGVCGKFGLNAGGGVEMTFKKIPLAIQTDFRPGYGMLFDKNNTRHYFDWSLNVSVRYLFKR